MKLRNVELGDRFRTTALACLVIVTATACIIAVHGYRKTAQDLSASPAGSSSHTTMPGLRMTAGLSRRERQILKLVARGLTNKDVANTLQISQFTVRNHLNHITEKLDVSDRAEAIFIAIQTGIITV